MRSAVLTFSFCAPPPKNNDIKTNINLYAKMAATNKNWFRKKDKLKYQWDWNHWNKTSNIKNVLILQKIPLFYLDSLKVNSLDRELPGLIADFYWFTLKIHLKIAVNKESNFVKKKVLLRKI